MPPNTALRKKKRTKKCHVFRQLVPLMKPEMNSVMVSVIYCVPWTYTQKRETKDSICDVAHKLERTDVCCHTEL